MNMTDTELTAVDAETKCHLCGASGLMEFPAFPANISPHHVRLPRVAGRRTIVRLPRVW